MNSIAREVLDLVISLLPVTVLLILVIAGLAVFVLALGTLLRTFHQTLSQGSPEERSGMDSRTSPATQADTESDHEPDRLATPDEQQEAIDRLSRMPQFLRLDSGDLLDLSNGATLSYGDVDADQSPVLKALRDGQYVSLLLATRRGLCRYVEYQRRVAAVLSTHGHA